ncbi:MAG: zinc finger CCCH domain-containing protein [Patescibacteria group bacterium]|nr:zinc finger CCCH domain-containing protein [Patescibacteria group bacterium]
MSTAVKACKNGAACTFVGCKFSHPAGFVAPAAKPCNFGLKCTRAGCTFSHPEGFVAPTAKACNFGLKCTRAGCTFSHPDGFVAPTGTGRSETKKEGKRDRSGARLCQNLAKINKTVEAYQTIAATTKTPLDSRASAAIAAVASLQSKVAALASESAEILKALGTTEDAASSDGDE